MLSAGRAHAGERGSRSTRLNLGYFHGHGIGLQIELFFYVTGALTYLLLGLLFVGMHAYPPGVCYGLDLQYMLPRRLEFCRCTIQIRTYLLLRNDGCGWMDYYYVRERGKELQLPGGLEPRGLNH